MARLFLLVLLLSTPPAALGMPPEPPPLAGKGLVILPAPVSSGELVFYEFPGVRRIGSFRQEGLPMLTPAVRVKGGETALGVLSVREGWLRIACDASGREGWIEQGNGWSYRPWEHYLPGRTIRPAPGLKEVAYRLRVSPTERGVQDGAASPGFPFLVRSVRDDWAAVETAGQPRGWLRWRDGDGRLLVTVE